MEGFLANILPILGVLGVGGIITGVILRRIDKMEKRSEQREDARKRESVLVIAGLKSCGHLAEESAVAIKRGGEWNGELETALKYYAKNRDKLNDFLVEQSAERNYG